MGWRGTQGGGLRDSMMGNRRQPRRALRIGCSAALVACALATARTAVADDAREPTAVATEPLFEVVWREVAAGRLPEAVVTLRAMGGGEILATNGVLFVLERWIANGGIPRRRAVAPADQDAVATSSSWDVRFNETSLELVDGDAARAMHGFVRLMVSGPDPERISAARRLGELASLVAVVQAREAPEERATSAAPEGPAFKPYTRSYAGYVLLVDGINIVTAPVLIGLGGYLFAAPIVHAIQGRPLYGLASFGFRLAMPIIGAVVGAGISKDKGLGGLGAAAAGLVVGMVGAMILDAATLCQVRVTSKPAAANGTRGLPFVPLAGLRAEGGFDLGVGGAF